MLLSSPVFGVSEDRVVGVVGFFGSVSGVSFFVFVTVYPFPALPEIFEV